MAGRSTAPPHVMMVGPMKKLRSRILGLLVGLCLPAALLAQIHLDRISAGIVAVHDHAAFDYHMLVRNDPYPHETKEGYAFDGAELVLRLHWDWQGARLLTRFQFSPARRSHFAYDQDTDFKGNTNSTHGDEGQALSRTLAVTQRMGLITSRRWGQFWGQIGFWDQPTRYGEGVTFDLNSNPALPSSSYTRVIPEQANIHEIRFGLGWSYAGRWGGWRWRESLTGVPVTSIRLINLIPNQIVTSLLAYGGQASLSIFRPIGLQARRPRGLRLALQAGRYDSFGPVMGFRREVFAGSVAWCF